MYSINYIRTQFIPFLIIEIQLKVVLELELVEAKNEISKAKFKRYDELYEKFGIKKAKQILQIG